MIVYPHEQFLKSLNFQLIQDPNRDVWRLTIGKMSYFVILSTKFDLPVNRNYGLQIGYGNVHLSILSQKEERNKKTIYYGRNIFDDIEFACALFGKLGIKTKIAKTY